MFSFGLLVLIFRILVKRNCIFFTKEKAKTEKKIALKKLELTPKMLKKYLNQLKKTLKRVQINRLKINEEFCAKHIFKKFLSKIDFLADKN